MESASPDGGLLLKRSVRRHQHLALNFMFRSSYIALSDATVRQATATGKDYTVGDTDGLSLGVTAAGGKSWHFRYAWAGKQKRMSLGTYPEVGLRQARSLREEARRLIAQGTHPCTHRRHQRHTHHLAEQNTFQAMYALWLEHRGRVLKKGRQSTQEQIERIFDNDVLPALGKSSIYPLRCFSYPTT
ncbi:Prophage CP4-57 integrase [compost metagenome]